MSLASAVLSFFRSAESPAVDTAAPAKNSPPQRTAGTQKADYRPPTRDSIRPTDDDSSGSYARKGPAGGSVDLAAVNALLTTVTQYPDPGPAIQAAPNGASGHGHTNGAGIPSDSAAMHTTSTSHSVHDAGTTHTHDIGMTHSMHDTSAPSTYDAGSSMTFDASPPADAGMSF